MNLKSTLKANGIKCNDCKYASGLLMTMSKSSKSFISINDSTGEVTLTRKVDREAICPDTCKCVIRNIVRTFLVL